MQLDRTEIRTDIFGREETVSVESAVMLVRLAADRSEVGRRIFGSPIAAEERVRVIATAGSRSYFAIAAGSTVDLEVDPGMTLPASSFLLVLNADLSSASWALPDAGFFSEIDVANDGAVAGVGIFSGTWSPVWSSDTWTTMDPPGRAADAFAVSFGPAGEHLWTRVHQGPDRDYNLGVAYDGRGNILVSGYFSGDMNVAPRGFLSHSVSGFDTCDAYYALLGREDGFVLDARSLRGSQCETVYYTLVDPFGGLVLLGGFGETITLLSGSRYSTLGRGLSNVFFLRVSDL